MEGTAAGWSGQMLDSMNDFRGQSSFTDVTLITIDGTQINAHSLVLAAGSGHFKDALLKVRASGSVGTIMIKLTYTTTCVQHIVNFLYNGKISVPQAEMKEIKNAAKALTIPVLEALCDTYTKNLEQFMQANAIPQNSEVTVQITHHVGSENEEQVTQDKLSENGIAVELADPQTVTTEDEEPGHVTVEYDPETQTVQIQQAESAPERAKEQENSAHIDSSIDTLLVAASSSLTSGNPDGVHYTTEEAYQVDSSGVITTLEEVSKTVSIESLLANQSTVTVTDVLEEQVRSNIRAAASGSAQVYRYRCNICNKDFSSLYRLKGHHATHFGEKAHQCGICGKRYIQLEYLREHESVHTNERPFKCNVCDKDFRVLRHLKKHQITHSAKRPYNCLVCSKTFQRSDRLKSHMRTHSGDRPFECQLCGKKFSQRETLVKHHNTHNELRPFKCSICLSAFKRKDGLMAHLETHRVGSRFVCGVEGCGGGFNQLIHLKKHISSVHHITNVDSAVVERPRISESELDEILAQIQEKPNPEEDDNSMVIESSEAQEENALPPATQERKTTKVTAQITQEQLEVIQQVVQEVVVDNRPPTVLLI